MATPALDCLRQNFPAARFIGVIRSYAKAVIEDGPWFDRLVECNDKTFAGFFKVVRTLSRLHPDLAVVMPNSFRSALIARLAAVKAICGYRRGGRSWLLTGGPAPCRGANGIRPVAMVQYYLEICRWLNLKVSKATRPRLFMSGFLKAKADQLLARYGVGPHDMVIGLNPGAKFGSSKCWPPEHFAALAELFAGRWDCKQLLFTGPDEAQIGRAIVKSSRAKIINTGVDRVDLGLLKPLIQRCQLLVTNDTGPRHYAVAFGVPVVVIMGPTDPRYTAANLEKTVVLRREMDCIPCHKRRCPATHECMTRIMPRQVFEASQRLMGELA